MLELSPSFTLFLSASLGLIFGSFANVVVHRLPRGLSVRSPGSRCPHCQSPVRWFQNIPVLSFLALRGQCASCRASISWRYPLIELLTAFLFVAMRLKNGWNVELLLRDFPMGVLLVSVVFIDIDHRIIPDRLSLGGLVYCLASSLISPHLGWAMSLIGALLGFGIFYGVAWLYEKRSGNMGLGGGDIKLLAMIGAFLGPSAVFDTILVSSISGSAFGIIFAILTRKKKLLSVSIPFGPFLVLGCFYAYFFEGGTWLPFTIPI